MLNKFFNWIFFYFTARCAYIGYVYWVDTEHKLDRVVSYDVFRSYSCFNIAYFLCMYLRCVKKMDYVLVSDSKKKLGLYFLYSFFI
jgi:hypothetical protein